MIRGMYTAATGMRTRQRQMDAVANNIANAGTTGYRRDLHVTQSFSDMLIRRMNDGAVSTVGPLNFGLRSAAVHTVFEQGALEHTGKGMDAAIAGSGFFVVQTPQGERYTRAGVMIRDAQGMLSTPEGHPFLGLTGPIQVPEGPFRIDQNGRIYAEDVYVDTLRIANFEDAASLVKENSTLFRHTGPEDNGTQPDGRILQGYLESANVDLSEELLRMISIQRFFDSNQRVLRMLDDSLAKAVNEVGRV